jgi:Protein of unknown function (DUF2934)
MTSRNTLSEQCDSSEDLLGETETEGTSSTGERSSITHDAAMFAGRAPGLGKDGMPVRSRAETEADLCADLASADDRSEPTHQEIAELAYQYWIQRNASEGTSEDDWFRAKNELIMGKSKSA